MSKMAKVVNIRDRALESRDAIELLSKKWRITVNHSPAGRATGELSALSKIFAIGRRRTLKNGMPRERDSIAAQRAQDP
jgi:hypothetical protein